MFYSSLSLNSLKIKVASLFELRVGVAQLQLDKTLGFIKSPSSLNCYANARSGHLLLLMRLHRKRTLAGNCCL